MPCGIWPACPSVVAASSIRASRPSAKLSADGISKPSALLLRGGERWIELRATGVGQAGLVERRQHADPDQGGRLARTGQDGAGSDRAVGEPTSVRRVEAVRKLAHHRHDGLGGEVGRTVDPTAERLAGRPLVDHVQAAIVLPDLDGPRDGRVAQAAGPGDFQPQEATQSVVAGQRVREDQERQRLASGSVGRLDQLAEREHTERFAKRVRAERLCHGGLSDRGGVGPRLMVSQMPERTKHETDTPDVQLTVGHSSAHASDRHGRCAVTSSATPPTIATTSTAMIGRARVPNRISPSTVVTTTTAAAGITTSRTDNRRMVLKCAQPSTEAASYHRRMASLTAVVIGAGALGASTAYHLARRGVAVTLVDQQRPGSQTSPRAAGLTNTKAAPTEIMARLTDEATETLARFEQETGHALEFHRSGSVKAAYTEIGEARLLTDLGVARALGIEVDLISAAEARRLAPWFEPGSPRAIGYVPSDAYLEPSRLPIAYVQLAQAAGAQVLPFTARHRAAPAGRSCSGRLDAARRPASRRRGGRGRRLGARRRRKGRDPAAAGAGPAPALHHRADLRCPGRAADRPIPGGQHLRAARARRPAGGRLRGRAPRRATPPSEGRRSRSPTWSSTSACCAGWSTRWRSTYRS